MKKIIGLVALSIGGVVVWNWYKKRPAAPAINGGGVPTNLVVNGGVPAPSVTEPQEEVAPEAGAGGKQIANLSTLYGGAIPQ